MTMSDIEKAELNADAKPAPVQILAQYIKDLSFENPNAPHSLRASVSTSVKPQMDVNIILDAVKINDDRNPDLYESTLTLTVRSMREQETVFISEIAYAALVSLKNIPEQHIKPLLYIDIPQMLFPFARAIVATSVTDGGFPPVLLNPVDFRAMFVDANQRGQVRDPQAA